MRFFTIFHAKRAWDARQRANALSQGQPGNRRRPLSLSTLLMGAGLLTGALGLLLIKPLLLLAGPALFLLGIVWAVVEGLR